MGYTERMNELMDQLNKAISDVNVRETEKKYDDITKKSFSEIIQDSIKDFPKNK